MGKAQASMRCKTCSAITSLSHRCPKPPRFTQPVAGLAIGPAWSADDWAQHYAERKGEVEEAVKAADGIEHGGKVLNGDVWRLQLLQRTFELVIDADGAVDGDEYVYANGKRNCFTKQHLFRDGKLISRAAEAPRKAGEMRKGDRVLLRSVKWEGVVLLARECADGSGRTVVRVRWDRGGEAEYFAESLELVKAVQ